MSTEENKPADYSHISWGPVSAVLGTIGIFFGAQLIVGLGLYIVLFAAGWDEARIRQWLTGENQAQFVVSLAVAVATLGLLYVFLRRRNAHPDELGLGLPKLKDILYVLQGAAMYIALYIGVVNLLAGVLPGLDTEQTQELGFTAGAAESELVLIFIALVVLPPIVEEIVVRGFLFSGLRKGFTFWPAAIASSLIFGLAHLRGGEGGSTIWIAFVDTALLGMVLAYLREKTGRLWAPIGLHALKNGVAFLALFVFNLG